MRARKCSAHQLWQLQQASEEEAARQLRDQLQSTKAELKRARAEVKKLSSAAEQQRLVEEPRTKSPVARTKVGPPLRVVLANVCIIVQSTCFGETLLPEPRLLACIMCGMATALPAAA